MLRQAAVDVAALARLWQLPPLITHILAVRGFRYQDEVSAFWQAEKQPLPPPQIMADLSIAIEIIATASATGKKIAIFGDYDADGITSTVILHKTLTAVGAEPIYYIPRRESEGYGLNNEAIAQLKHDQQVDLLITCDNGISSFDQVLYAKSLGMQVIVLDHHDLPLDQANQQQLVAADAVIDPKRQDCPYPFKHYCAAGLSYRFAEALFTYLNKDWVSLKAELLPFAVLGTVCDLVELSGDNRSLVKQGLPLIATSTNLGVQSLLKANGIVGEQLTTYHLGYRLGPCINASGRLEAASLAVELFLTTDKLRAEELANYLVELNETRKDLTEKGTRAALDQLAVENLLEDKILLLHCPELHESVAGIIAGQLKERFQRPVIVAAGQQDIIRASCRSIEAYNIFEGLSACKQLFINFGGHPLAAGITLTVENFQLLRQILNKNCNLTATDLEPIYRIDKKLELYQADLTLAKQLANFEPFGKGNPPLIFASQQVSLQKIALLGREGQVMRLTICDSKTRQIKEAICFKGKEKLQELVGTDTFQQLLGQRAEVLLDILYSLEINTYQGRQSAQIQIKDFRLAE